MASFSKKPDKLLFLLAMSRMTMGAAGQSRELSQIQGRELRLTASTCSGQLFAALCSNGHSEHEFVKFRCLFKKFTQYLKKKKCYKSSL